MFKGYKTYLVSFALFIIGGLVWVGILDQQTGTALSVMLTGGAFAALRASKPS